MTKVELLTVEKFCNYWSQIEKQLDFVPHLWALWWTKESIYSGVVSGGIQCWGVGDENVVRAVIFSRVSLFPANTIFQAFLAFGDGLVESIDEVEAVFERYCMMRGCTVAEISGRPGWENVLRRKGFGRTGTVMTKKLELRSLN